MKPIVHLIGQLERGGAERQLIYLAESLQVNGWQQIVVTFCRLGEDSLEPSVEKLGIPLLYVPHHILRPFRLAWLFRMLLPYRGAILQSWSLHTNFYAYLLPSFLYSGLIFSFRANPAIDTHSGLPARTPQAFIYKKADCVISNSRRAVDDALQQGLEIRRAVVVNNITRVHGRAHPAEIGGITRIVAAGNLIPRKAYDVLLQALAKVNKPYVLLFAGAGSERTKLERMAYELNVNVKFLGEIEDVPSLMSTCHIMVHPSRMEGLSNTILEAMAEGLPVITTFESGMEWITHGENGLLVPADQPDPLAEQISRLISDPTLRARLGQAGLQKVANLCGTKRVTSQYEEVYRRLNANAHVS